MTRSDRPTHWINFADAGRKASDAASVVFDRNLISGGDRSAVQVQDNASNGSLGPNNQLGIDPRFAATSGAGAFVLQAASPAVDRGFGLEWPGFVAPSLDRLGAPRPRGATLDLGAIESF